jgi:hypothetical protein
MLGIRRTRSIAARLAAMPWRRCVGALIAAVFLIVTVGHIYQHYQAGHGGGIEFSATHGHDDAPPDPANDITAASDHCHGCTVATLPAHISVPQDAAPASHAPPFMRGVTPHIAAHDPPPPRATA